LWSKSKAPAPVDREFELVVDDWRLDGQGQAEAFGGLGDAAGPGRLGNVLTVGGTAAPRKETVAPGARLRLRLANVCNARVMRVRFDGLKAWDHCGQWSAHRQFRALARHAAAAAGHAL
jgi:FtsP/CotA-like multicopper oxidase with cupredoxin domain